MEPFGFFSVDALRAGWYLIWRQLVRVLPVGAGAVLIGIFLMSRGLRRLGGFLIGIGLIVAAVWAAVLIPRLTSQWSQAYYGFPLTGGGSLWWNVSWRTWVASFVAAIVLTPPQMVAASLKAAFPGSALGGLGSLLSALLGLANIAVALLATGWAMSRVALAQSGNFFDTVPASMQDPLGPTVSEPTLEPAVITPVAAHPVAVRRAGGRRGSRRGGRAPRGGRADRRAAAGGARRLAPLAAPPRRPPWPPSATRESGSARSAASTRPSSERSSAGTAASAAGENPGADAQLLESTVIRTGMTPSPTAPRARAAA